MNGKVLVRFRVVLPHAGAWIETQEAKMIKACLICLPPCGGVVIFNHRLFFGNDRLCHNT